MVTEIRRALTPAVLAAGEAAIRAAVKGAYRRVDAAVLAAAQAGGVVGQDPSTSTLGGATSALAIAIPSHPLYVVHAGDAR